MTLGSLLADLRRARGLSQVALAEAAGLSRSTVAGLERRTTRRAVFDTTGRALLECLAAAAPLSDEQCARFLELSGLSKASKSGVLEDEDRAREIELGVIADPDDPDGRRRPTRRAFSAYGARVARVRDVGMDQLAQASPTSPDAATAAMVLSAHRMLDELAAHGGILAATAALLPLMEDARAGRRVGVPRDVPNPSPALPPLPPERSKANVRAASHTIQPGGMVTTVYRPEDQPPPPAQARRKSG